ncbi:hypothetical protein EUTSA_v10022128mg [Eutrema salsugineum]|uniref:Uncharacterized protein n=1 Tax=Eutrema salsugineum TaxID=72664 RepID=V4LUP2_EUTSA|nr:hypothetical protein EUTSA_v10022128mg [Eutrema salsugineum]
MMCTTLKKSMPAIAFFGRMAFASVFSHICILREGLMTSPLVHVSICYADHFGDGGPLEKKIGPAVNVMTKYGSKVLTFYTGMQVVAFDVLLLEFSLIGAKGAAALWFIFGQSIPALLGKNINLYLEKMFLATQILSTVIPFPNNLNNFTQNLTSIGVLLYYIGLKHSIDNLEEGEKNKEKETEDDKTSTSKAKAN